MRRRRLRPFRLGLWIGAASGVVWFVQRYQRSRQELEAVEAGGWSVVEATVETSSPAAAAAPPEPMPSVPVVPIVEPEVTEVGDVATEPGEPDVEPTPVPEPVAAEPEPEPEPEPVPEPVAVEPEPVAPPPVKKAAKKKAAAKKAAAKKAPALEKIPAPWVAPEAGGICPTSHPVKAKLSSKLFHLPGMFAYARTNPDRCYRDEAAAEADGLTRAKR